MGLVCRLEESVQFLAQILGDCGPSVTIVYTNEEDLSRHVLRNAGTIPFDTLKLLDT